MDEKKEKCQCGGMLSVCDYLSEAAYRDGLPGEGSRMHLCSQCGHYTLSVTLCEEDNAEARDMYSASVFLKDFHLKRRLRDDDEGWKRPHDDLQMATNLCLALQFDQWPSMAAITDWGIETERHLDALFWLFRAGAGPFDFDRVIGDGTAITALVRAMRSNPDPDVVFCTPYDNVNWLHEDDEF